MVKVKKIIADLVKAGHHDLAEELSAGLDSLPEWVDSFYKRNPSLRKYQPKVREKQGGSGSHPEARQSGNEVWIFPKFWKLDGKTRDWVFAHELGHYAKPDSMKLLRIAEKHGIDLWDTDTLPYGQFNFEEAFADAFAAYFLNPRELQSRYPKWVKLIKEVR